MVTPGYVVKRCPKMKNFNLKLLCLPGNLH